MSNGLQVIDIIIRQSWVDYANMTEDKDRTRDELICHSAIARHFQDCSIDFDYMHEKIMDFDFLINGRKIIVVTMPTHIETEHFDSEMFSSLFVRGARKKDDTDIYLFVTIIRNRVFILGWVAKPVFWDDQLTRFKTIAKKRYRILSQDLLQPMDYLEILLNDD